MDVPSGPPDGTPEFKGIKANLGARDRVNQKVETMKENMTEGDKKYTTFAAAEVELDDGAQDMWVSAAGKRGDVPERIHQGDTVIKNKVTEGNSQNRLNDAEQTLMREADEKKAKIKALGATRPMCEKCQDAAIEKDILDTVVTPLKKRNN
jgi:hypothetical protein